MSALGFFLAGTAGLATSIGVAMNNTVYNKLNYSGLTLIFSTLVTLVSLSVFTMVEFFLGHTSSLRIIASVPWWAWLAGFFGAIFLICVTFAPNLVGLGPTVAVVLVTQLAAAIIIDNFGLFGVVKRRATLFEFLGLGFVTIGAVFIGLGRE